MEKILIIEDEEAILVPLADNLKLEGYEVATATDGRQGLALAQEKRHDLLILDIMLPGMDGFEICRRLRQAGVTTPILVLTAKSEEIDKVLGLELGADDYVTKPFSTRELLARIKANLRRGSNGSGESGAKSGVGILSISDLVVDFDKYEIKRDGSPIELTFREFELVKFLLLQPGQIFS